VSQQDIVPRLVATEAGVEFRGLASGQLMQNDWPKISNGVERLSRYPMRIVDSTTFIGDDIRRHAEVESNPPRSYSLMTSTWWRPG